MSDVFDTGNFLTSLIKKSKKKPEGSEHPELWYMFDAVNNMVAGFHEFGDKDNEEEEYGFVLQIETFPSFKGMWTKSFV